MIIVGLGLIQFLIIALYILTFIFGTLMGMICGVPLRGLSVRSRVGHGERRPEHRPHKIKLVEKGHVISHLVNPAKVSIALILFAAAAGFGLLVSLKVIRR